MKNTGLLCLLVFCLAIVSCKKEQKTDENKTVKIQDEKPISVECYRALYENDSIELKINTLKDGKITGKMTMKVFERAKKEGNIEGSFHGDTLLVDYTFKQGINKATFKNPMAFLKKDNQLILGSGKIETYLGRSYFAKNTPINFETVKYKFSKVECQEK